MAVFWIGEDRYNLVLTVHAMEAIEKEFGDLADAMQKFRGKGRNIDMMKKMFRILANAGRYAAKQPEDLTGDEIDNLTLKGLDRLSTVMRNAMDEGMEAETVKGGPADDEEYDVYAEELEKQQKNGSAGGGQESASITDTP